MSEYLAVLATVLTGLFLLYLGCRYVAGLFYRAPIQWDEASDEPCIERRYRQAQGDR